MPDETDGIQATIEAAAKLRAREILQDSGQISGIVETMVGERVNAALRTDAPPPAGVPPAPKSVADMTTEEYVQHKKDHKIY